MGNAAAVARRVVAAVAGGAIPPELLAELADVVLDAEPVRLALEVRAGGPHALRRALELAALIAAGGLEAVEAGDGVKP